VSTTFPKDTNPQSDVFLTPEERAAMRRMLMFPEEFPPEFKNWLLEYVGVNGEIQQSQVRGLVTSLSPAFQVVTTSETTTSQTYVDLATVGPRITGLGDGVYLVLFGCQMVVTSNIFGGCMAVATDDVAASDATGFAIQEGVGEGPNVEFFDVPGMRALLLTLTHGGNNTLTAKYRFTAPTSGTNPSFANRWLAAIRVGNA
jgi:hypothetical protein